MRRVSQKVSVARLSVGSNLMLVLAKLAVGVAIGSVSVISEAIHSAMDLAAAVIALFSVRAASRPADQDHQYGHGKIENMSALVEGGLVLVAAVWIAYEAVGKLRHGGQAPSVGLGMLVMAFSAGLNWVVSGKLMQVARAEDSAALEADAVHLRTDVWTSVGVFAGLVLVRLTGLPWLDPLVALLVAAMIAKAGWDLCVQAMSTLVDARLPEAEEEEIVRLIEQHSSAFVEFHDLRTRRSGAERHIDFHLVVHGHHSLQEVHRLCDEIETAIGDQMPQAHVLIHPEPCGPDCDLCQGSRQGRRMLRAAPRKLRPRGSLMRRIELGHEGVTG